MSWTLTSHENITNVGGTTEVKEFDTWDELQDYVTEKETKMTVDEYELWSYNSKIKESV